MKKSLLSLMMLAACAMGAQADELTVADGTSTNSSVPFNGSWVDSNGTTCQVLFYADSLSEIPAGATITGIKFYLNASGVGFSNAEFQLSMGEVEGNPFASASSAITGLTVVSSNVANPEAGATEISFEFDEPYTYEGGNLVFETKVTKAGTWASTYFYGVNGEAGADNTAFSRNSTLRFTPKTTFIYDAQPREYAARVTPNALNFGKVTPGTEVEMNVTVTNRGTKAFTPAVSGLEAPFSTTYAAAELAAGAEVEIPVKFVADEEGQYSGTMTINCGEAGTFAVSLSAQASNELDFTVCEGTLGSANYPYKGTYTDTEGTFAQMIYSADLMAPAKDKLITGIVFYSSKDLINHGAIIDVSVAEIENSTFERETALEAPYNLATELTTVSSDTLPTGVKEWTITFAEPYAYKGGNLAIQTVVTTAGTDYESSNFYGQNQANGNVSYCAWASTKDLSNFLPKMTVLYKEDETVVGVDEVVAAQPVRVRYVNTMGQVSNKPFDGINIVVTEYDNGTTTATKVIK